MRIFSAIKLYILILFFLGSCAKQMPPRGGPEDKIPPIIVQIYPNTGATNVAKDLKIEIIFSELMTKKSVEDAIFFSPIPSERIKYHWKGKKLKIEFGDTLKANRTYVMTIGAKASDLRNNKMEDSYSLAFSTGDIIDQGQISGVVYSTAKVEGALVCAYAVTDNQAPDPANILADYYTQCNQQGSYTLMYIAPGKYRLFAINDKDLDRKYSRGTDAIGISSKDVFLTSAENAVTNIRFQLLIEDTSLVFLKSAYSIDRFKLDARFSEPIQKPDLFLPKNYFNIFKDNNAGDTLKIVNFYWDAQDQSTIHLITEPQIEKSYNLEAKNLFDLAGNGLDTTYNSVLFDGSSLPDTIQPSIVFLSIADSAKGIRVDSLFFIIFSESIQQHLFEQNFVFSEKDNKPISGKLAWKNPAAVSFVPAKSLKYSTGYIVNINTDSVKDMHGNSLKDSLFSVYFRTMSEDTLSSISGSITDDKIDAVGKIFLLASSSKNKYVINIDKPGPYTVENILPGIYTIYAFRDEDGNGVYSYGKAKPFVPAERFVFYPDSIKVRSKWPNEGENIILEH